MGVDHSLSLARCRPRCRAAWLPSGRSRGPGGRCGPPGFRRRPQAGDHQAGGGAQVGGHHGGAGELFSALASRATLPSIWIGAQAHQLVDVHEAVLKDGLGHRRWRPRRWQLSAMNCACMSVGKPGYSVVRNDCAFMPAAATGCGCRPRPAVTVAAGFAQLVDHGVEVVGAAVVQQRPRRPRPPRRTGRCRLRCGRPPRGACSRAASRRPGCGCGCVPWPSIFAPILMSISAEVDDFRLLGGVFQQRFRPRPARRPSGSSRCR